MKKCICFVFDKNFSYQGTFAINSAKEHNPDYTTILLTDIEDKKIADIQIHPRDIDIPIENWLLVGRIGIVEEALSNLSFDTAIFVDGDTLSYSSYEELQHYTENHSVVVIPHITRPLPEDNKYPQNRTISLSGNYNTGVWSASKKGLNFVKWWKQQTTILPITQPEHGLVAEQGWLRFAGDFDDNTKILRHPGYNVAYWNVKQRNVTQDGDRWLIDGENLVIFHFSGFNKGMNPAQMSIFQNRYWLKRDDPVYIIYNDYHNLVWNNSNA